MEASVKLWAMVHMQFYLPYNSYYPLFYNISARVLAILIILLLYLNSEDTAVAKYVFVLC